MKAVWNGVVVAESNDALMFDNNYYFPVESLQIKFFKPAPETSVCFWKGKANYYDVTVNGQTNGGAAWYYADPSPQALQIKGRVAFWKGIKVTN